MAFVESLIAALVRANGDGLVMREGDRACVVAPSGSVYVSSRPLTSVAVSSILAQLLPPDAQRTLMEFGAVEHELPLPATASQTPGDRFKVMAARASHDIRIELRRCRLGAPAPVGAFAAAAATASVAPFPDVSERQPIDGPTRQLRGTARGVPSSAVALSLAPPLRPETTSRHTTERFSKHDGLGRLLRVAAARGASTLYIMAQSRPSIRIDDDVIALEGEPPLTQADIEPLIMELAPAAHREMLRESTNADWMCDVLDVGRVRCLSFRDHRGLGGVFRLIPTRIVTADQLGLSREIRALCSEREGLVLIGGPRLSGKSTLVSACIDLINRSRADYIITLESEIKFVHESRRGMVSQREARGDHEQMLVLARAALRENPDVLVIDDLRSPELVAFALEAADSGHLVIGTVTAHSATGAVDRIIDQAPADRQAHTALALADTLRGAVAQVLLRKSGGGRAAARELLLGTPAVASLIAEGKTSQLPLAIDGGRKDGMVPMNDALVAFVQSGAIDEREAFRKAFNRQALAESLKRERIDTSSAGRLGHAPASGGHGRAGNHRAGLPTGAFMAGAREDNAEVLRGLQYPKALPDLQAPIQSDALRLDLPELPVTRSEPPVPSPSPRSKTQCPGCGSSRDLYRAHLRAHAWVLKWLTKRRPYHCEYCDWHGWLTPGGLAGYPGRGGLGFGESHAGPSPLAVAKPSVARIGGR